MNCGCLDRFFESIGLKIIICAHVRRCCVKSKKGNGDTVWLFYESEGCERVFIIELMALVIENR